MNKVLLGGWLLFAAVAPAGAEPTRMAREIVVPAPKPVDNNAKAPNAAIVEALLRKQWEKSAAAGLDGAQTVSIQNLKIGRTRPWTYNDGNGGQEGLKVWDLRLGWTLTTHYRTRNNVYVRNYTYSIFKNALDEWVLVSHGGEESHHDDAPDM